MPRSFDDHFGRFTFPNHLSVGCHYLFLGASTRAPLVLLGSQYVVMGVATSSTFGVPPSPWTCSILYFGLSDAWSSSKDTTPQAKCSNGWFWTSTMEVSFLTLLECHKMDDKSREWHPKHTTIEECFFY